LAGNIILTYLRRGLAKCCWFTELLTTGVREWVLPIHVHRHHFRWAGSCPSENIWPQGHLRPDRGGFGWGL